MKRIGVIEIGANSVTLTLNEVEEDGYFRPIDELNTSIRLCQDLIDGTELSKEKLATTLSTLRAFKSMCQLSGAKRIIAIATETFRSASNSDELLNLIKDALDIDVKILDIKSEIYYNFLGVSNTISFDNALIVDIEGTATHLTWVNNNKIKAYYTIPAGTLNLTSEYRLNDRILREDLDSAKTIVEELLFKCNWLTNGDFENIIGIGGTLQCLGKMDRLRKRYPLDISHNYNLTDLDAHEIYNLLKCKSLKQRKAVYGLPYERADIIVAGLCIFQVILYMSRIKNITISSNGLREGIMYEYIDSNYPLEKDMLNYSIKGILNMLNINKVHAKHVRWICESLFDDLKPIHKLDDACKKILKTASLLHDCGISIDYYNHHKHSFYVILNSPINGLSHKGLLMSASIAACHRNNQYHVPLPPFSSIINKIDIKAIEYMGAILRIAEGLDRSLEGAVKNIKTVIEEDTVFILLESPLSLELEIRQAMRSACFFKEVYNKTLVIKKND